MTARPDVGVAVRPSPAWRTRAAALAWFLGATLAAMAVALVNGFPLMFMDSGYFLTTAAIFDVPWNRPIFYGALLGGVIRSLGIWGVVAVQSAITVASLALLLRVAAGRGMRFAFGVVLLLSCLTSLPWFTGMIMPDLFQAPLVVACYLLVFHWRDLGSWSRALCLILIWVGILVHFANYMLVVGLAALLFAWRWFDRRGGIALAPVGLVLGIGAVAIAMQMAVNYVGYGRPSLTEGAPAYTLSRLVETGLAKRYLDAHCGAETYVLCDYRDRPATYVGWYIFDPGSPFRAVWNRGVPHTDLVIGAHRSEAESLAIIGGTLREFPLATAWQMALATAQQLMSIHTAEAIGPTLGRDWIEDAVRIYYPDLYPSYARSLQNRDLLPLSAVRVLHVLVADASLFLLIFLAVRGALGRSWLGRFSLFLLLVYLLNAFISGVLAGPANRYGSRLVWLVVLAAALAVYEHRQFLRGEFRRLLPRRADAA